jgi:tetrahydrodipicolinate N-succinyltransferase
VEFGNNIDINANFSVLTHDFGSFVLRGFYKDFVNSSGKVTIGNNIVFGRNVTIMKGVSIGDNCIIGAGSIVTKSIPANSVAVGVPARVLCSLEEYYKKRKALQEQEAIDYAKELSSYKGGIDKLRIEDFTEEWVLFLSEDEYNRNEAIKKHVDFRLQGRVNIHEFLNRRRPYSNFSAFIEAIKNNETK